MLMSFSWIPLPFNFPLHKRYRNQCTVEGGTASVPPHIALLWCFIGLQLQLYELCPTTEAIAQKFLVMGRTKQVVLNVLLRKVE